MNSTFIKVLPLKLVLMLMPQATLGSSWSLVWSDEFHASEIDSAKWNHAVDCNGGGNDERQCYTADPKHSFVSGGRLKILALPSRNLPLPFASARLSTKGIASWKYGRIVVRAKAPKGQGAWPAIWMLPEKGKYGGWPRSGEIDIFEAINLSVPLQNDGVEKRIHGTLHFGRGWPNNDSLGMGYVLPADANPAESFHDYAIEWEAGEIRWYVDGILYQTQRGSVVQSEGDKLAVDNLRGWYTETEGKIEAATAPFDESFYLILNYAVGGRWPESKNLGGIERSAFHEGNAFEIEFVRVYQCTDKKNGCRNEVEGYDRPTHRGGTLNTRDRSARVEM